MFSKSFFGKSLHSGVLCIGVTVLPIIVLYHFSIRVIRPRLMLQLGYSGDSLLLACALFTLYAGYMRKPTMVVVAAVLLALSSAMLGTIGLDYTNAIAILPSPPLGVTHSAAPQAPERDIGRMAQNVQRHAFLQLAGAQTHQITNPLFSSFVSNLDQSNIRKFLMMSVGGVRGGELDSLETFLQQWKSATTELSEPERQHQTGKEPGVSGAIANGITKMLEPIPDREELDASEIAQDYSSLPTPLKIMAVTILKSEKMAHKLVFGVSLIAASLWLLFGMWIATSFYVIGCGALDECTRHGDQFDARVSSSASTNGYHAA